MIFYQQAWQASVKGPSSSCNRISKMELLCGGDNPYCKLPIAVLYFNLLIVRSTYWNEVSYTMQSIRDEDAGNGKKILRKGFIGTFSIILAIFGSHHNWTALSPSTTQHNITQLDFFDLNYRFIQDQSYYIFYEPGGNENIKDSDANKSYPNIWLPADNLGKSLFSVVLSDLGQKTSSILTDTAVLQKYTEEFPRLQSLPQMNAETGPAKASYENLKNSTGPLQTLPAVISAKYLCQVPRRRAMGTLIMALILANLVLMRAAWAILTFFTSLYVARFDPTGKLLPKYCSNRSQMELTCLFAIAHHCAGCTKQATSYSVSTKPVTGMFEQTTKGIYQPIIRRT